MRSIFFFLLCRMIIAGITSSGALKLIEMSEPGIVGRLISYRINPAENNNKNRTRKAVYFANTSLNGSSFAVNFNAVKVITATNVRIRPNLKKDNKKSLVNEGEIKPLDNSFIE